MLVFSRNGSYYIYRPINAPIKYKTKLTQCLTNMLSICISINTDVENLYSLNSMNMQNCYIPLNPFPHITIPHLSILKRFTQFTMDDIFELKILWQRENLLILSNYFFCRKLFLCCLQQIHDNAYAFGKELNIDIQSH